MGYIGAFNSPYIGGIEGTKHLLEHLSIQHHDDFHVLEIGCATGYTSCWIGEEYGCKVTGVDLSDILIEKAQERAEKKGLDNVDFRVGDAMNLPFHDDSFDVAFGVAVTALLPYKKKALSEYYRVVRQGGIVGTLDLFSSNDAPLELIRQISDVMSRILGGDIGILTIGEWKSLLDNSPLAEKNIDEQYGSVFENPRDRLSAASAIFKLLYHLLVNKSIRTQFSEAMQLRKTLNMNEVAEHGHIGYLTFTGRKH